MTRGIDDLVLAAIAVCIGLASCLDCTGERVLAQSRPTVVDVADVARCLVAEDERGVDWSAILDVLERRAAAHGMRTASMARVYCAVHRSRSPSARQARILALPGGRPSARLAGVYRRAVDAARAGGDGACPAEHWGAPTGEDYARAVRAGWVRVECVDGGRNAFWRTRP